MKNLVPAATKQSIVLVINDLKPEFLKNIGLILKNLSANITLVKRVPLSEQGPIENTTQAYLDLSASSHKLGISASQQVIHGSTNQSVLAKLVKKGPIDAMIVSENGMPTLLKHPMTPDLEALSSCIHKKDLTQEKSASTILPTVRGKSYEHLFTKVKTVKQQNHSPEYNPLPLEYKF